MWQSEKGIVTGTVRHNDGTCIVRIFTESHGMVPFIFYLSKKGKKTSRNTLLQPLTQIEFQTDYIPTEALMHIRDPKNIFPYKDIPFNPIKSAISLFVGEFLTHSLRQEQSNIGLYNYIIQSIRWLDGANEEDCANFHLLFALKSASFTGICPNVDGFTPGYFLDLREGIFTPLPPEHQDFVDAQLSFKIASLLKCDLNNMSTVPLTRTERIAILNHLNLYFRLHIPEFTQLKSIEILQMLFG